MTVAINNILASKWFEGTVAEGKGRGKRLGFPTINLLTAKINFPFGIYFCEVKYKNNKPYKGLLFYGPRPTFNEQDESLEIYIVNFPCHSKLVSESIIKIAPGDLVQFKLMKYLREVKKFSSEKELIKQIKKDLQAI